MIRYLTLAIIFFLLSVAPLSAQELEDLFTRYSSEQSKGYAQPLADVVGANMNSGWYRNAVVNRQKFQLYIGLVGLVGLIPEKQKSFTATTPEYFNPTKTVEAPTIFGPTEGVRVQGANGTSYTFSGGAGMNILPLAVPQISLGGILGTEVSFRFFAFNINDDVGKIDVFGWGIRHSISQYFANPALDLAVGYYNTSFNFTDIAKSRSGIFSLQGSYRAGILEFYGGPGYETSSFDLSYDRSAGDQTERVNLSLDGINKLRMTLGLGLNLGALKLNVDYNLSRQSTLAAGIGLGFGHVKKSEI
ncbi:hypothetical protein BH23BAC1_BH23BAC1_38490 [soil metagenome]